MAMIAAPATSDAQPEPEKVGEYEKLVKKAEEQFADQAWAKARANFKKAYSVHPDPILLFNIASTYRREGLKEDALQYYKKYLEVAPPDADYRGVTEEAIVNIEEQIEAEKNAGKPVAGPSTSSGSGKFLRYSGLVAGVVGIGVLSFGVYQGLEARELNDRFENLEPGTEWTQELQDEFERGESLEQQAIILSIVGGVAIAAGGALYIAGVLGDSSDERQVAVTPVATPDGAGFAVSGRF